MSFSVTFTKVKAICRRPSVLMGTGFAQSLQRVRANHRVREPVPRLLSLLTATANWRGFPQSSLGFDNLLKELTELTEHFYTDSHDLLQRKDADWNQPKEEACKAGSRSTKLEASLVVSPWSQVHILTTWMEYIISLKLNLLGWNWLINLYKFQGENYEGIKQKKKNPHTQTIVWWLSEGKGCGWRQEKVKGREMVMEGVQRSGRVNFGWWAHNAVYSWCVIELYTWSISNQRSSPKPWVQSFYWGFIMYSWLISQVDWYQVIQSPTGCSLASLRPTGK